MAGAIYRIAIERATKPPLYYLGQTVQYEERCAQHLRALRAGRHDNVRLQRSFAKYGEAAVSCSRLIICRPLADDLTLYEQSAVDFYLATYGERRVLNVMRRCVNSHLGVKRRPETKHRLSASLTGKKRTPEQVTAMIARLRGFRHSEESRQRMSEAQKMRPRHPNSLAALAKARTSPKRLAALRSALNGKPRIHTEETKRKIAASLRGRKQSPELIERRVAPLRGRKRTGHNG